MGLHLISDIHKELLNPEPELPLQNNSSRKTLTILDSHLGAQTRLPSSFPYRFALLP